MTLLKPLMFILLPFAVEAGDHIESIKSLMPYEIVKTTVDSKLKKTEAAFDFVFVDRSNTLLKGAVQFSYNGKNVTTPARSQGRYTQKLVPGKYKFQFFYNQKHLEVYTDSIAIKRANRIELKVYFDRVDVIQVADKPVIYLYPEQPTDVHIELSVKGEMGFTYPEYKTGRPEEQEQPGWTVKAGTDGTLQQGNKIFKYLFWEGQIAPVEPQNNSEGFVKSTAGLTAFFEEKLGQMGLNSIETQDFVTYWVPRMQQYPKHLIRFIWNDEYDQIAHLSVSPQPDQMIRLFMLWQPLQQDQDITLQEQTLPVLERKGFTLVEWGGTQITNPKAE